MGFLKSFGWVIIFSCIFNVVSAQEKGEAPFRFLYVSLKKPTYLYCETADYRSPDPIEIELNTRRPILLNLKIWSQMVGGQFRFQTNNAHWFLNNENQMIHEISLVKKDQALVFTLVLKNDQVSQLLTNNEAKMAGEVVFGEFRSLVDCDITFR